MKLFTDTGWVFMRYLKVRSSPVCINHNSGTANVVDDSVRPCLFQHREYSAFCCQLLYRLSWARDCDDEHDDGWGIQRHGRTERLQRWSA